MVPWRLGRAIKNAHTRRVHSRRWIGIKKYVEFTKDLGIAEEAKVIPNRWRLTHPSEADLLDPTFIATKKTRFEQTISTIGLFAMHGFWAAHGRVDERKERVLNMLTALITSLLPYKKDFIAC